MNIDNQPAREAGASDRPWYVEIVWLPFLLSKVGVPQVDFTTATRLLRQVSQAVSDTGSLDEAELQALFKGAGKQASAQKQFLDKVLALTPEERLACCLPHDILHPQTLAMNVCLINGRALVVDPHVSEEPFFGNDPIGWIRNGLWAITPDHFPLPPSVFAQFVPCSALTLRPSEDEVFGRKMITTTVPMLHVGDRFVNRAIQEWREYLWFEDIKDGYSQAGQEIQSEWLRQVPNATEPDPVYRYILDPSSVRLWNEASMFLQHAHRRIRGAAEPRPETIARNVMSQPLPRWAETSADKQPERSDIINGPFGLRLDNVRHTVSRVGYADEIVDLSHSNLLWNVLVKLAAQGDKPLAREAIAGVWRGKGSGIGYDDSPEPGTVHNAMHDLRHKLAPLKVNPKAVKNMGYQLVDITSEAAGRKNRPSSRKPSRGKSQLT